MTFADTALKGFDIEWWRFSIQTTAWCWWHFIDSNLSYRLLKFTELLCLVHMARFSATSVLFYMIKYLRTKLIYGTFFFFGPFFCLSCHFNPLFIAVSSDISVHKMDLRICCRIHFRYIWYIKQPSKVPDKSSLCPMKTICPHEAPKRAKSSTYEQFCVINHKPLPPIEDFRSYRSWVSEVISFNPWVIVLVSRAYGHKIKCYSIQMLWLTVINNYIILLWAG